MPRHRPHALQTKTLTTVRDWWRYIATQFSSSGLYFGHGCDNAVDEAAWLICHSLHLTHENLPTFLDARLLPQECAYLQALMGKRIKTRKPLAYLLGEAWLADQRFICDDRALVPRSFIAPLVVSQFSPWLGNADKIENILDLCTGGGSLAILAALSFPTALVDAVDLSHSALKLAEENIIHYRLKHRIALIEGNLFAPIEKKRYDLILANPPYVHHQKIKTLPSEYTHEPVMGLDGGEDGFAVVREILAQVPRHLKAGGMLAVEIGHRRNELENVLPLIPFIWPQICNDTVFILGA